MPSNKDKAIPPPDSQPPAGLVHCTVSSLSRHPDAHPFPPAFSAAKLMKPLSVTRTYKKITPFLSHPLPPFAFRTQAWPHAILKTERITENRMSNSENQASPEQFAANRANAASSTDRKSTRLNSSHLGISYAVFC